MKNTAAKLWKTIAIAAVAAVVALAAVFGSYGIIYTVRRNAEAPVEARSYSGGSSDKIHFLNTGSSDAVLLESCGRFALIDCGEDSDNPRGLPGLDLEGYEDIVADYVKKVAGDSEGKSTLEFVIGTHAHSDHLGGFDTLISDPDITVKEAYLKRYYEDRIAENEVEEWDNQEVYSQMIAAALDNGVKLIQDLDDVSLSLGNFVLTLFNTGEAEAGKRVGENDNSLAVLVEKGGTKALLMGDVNVNGGVEKSIGKQVGKVDLLKVGHHGYGWSTRSAFLSATQPEIAVFTNKPEWVTFPVKFRLAMNSHTAMFATGEFNGIIAVLGDGAGEITLLKNIH